MNAKEFRSELDQRRGRQSELEKTLNNKKAELKEKIEQRDLHEKARELIKTAGLKTQEALGFHISDITSLALEAVFPEPYDLVVDFIERRNKTECDLLFKRNGQAVDPIEASGGGAVDVAAFALRVASWSMKHPRSRPTIILDEPMRFLSTDLQPNASLMLKEISEKLGIQFIIITHESELTQEADKVIEVSKRNGVSKITE